MDFEKVQAEWVLGRFPWNQLPEVAAQALMKGFEGPFILDLVGYAAPSFHRLKADVVEGAFREMGLAPITPAHALLRLARGVALRILRRETTPYGGAVEIAALADRGSMKGVRADLLEFQVCVDYIDEGVVGSRERYEQIVVELAWALLEEDPSR